MKIYEKLLNAKKSIGKVHKNAKNPHFKNSYADVNSLIETVEPILLENGLLLLQPVLNGKVITRIVDVETGENVESIMELPTLTNPQQMGSAITYYRRYTLQSLLSLQADDDDGNAASKPQPKAKPTLFPLSLFVTLIKAPKGSLFDAAVNLFLSNISPLLV